MIALFYRIVGWLGPVVTAVFAAFISAGYFFFLPARTANSIRFYRALFPDRCLFYHIRLTWKQYQNFARNFSERLLLNRPGKSKIQTESIGMEYLEQALDAGTGGVILMSHAGNWEVAARMLRRQGMRMMLFMGAKPNEQVERTQKKDLLTEDLPVVAANEGRESPLDILEGLKFLRQGGFVSMAGDLVWSAERQVSVTFMGRSVKVPDTPYLLAAIAKVPLFMFFSFRTGRRAYRIECMPPIDLKYESHQERDEVARQTAQIYAGRLERMTRLYPDQWYHFVPFFSEDQSA